MEGTKYPDLGALSIKRLLQLTLREGQDSPAIEELVARYGDSRDLTSLTFAELSKIRGVGPSKANALLASLELAKRLYTSKPAEQKSIHSPRDMADMVMGEMRYLDREHFRVALLNIKNHVLKLETVSIGTLNLSPITPRELFKMAIKCSAASVILIHNHPSGDPSPSREDIDVTERLIEAGKLLGVEVIGHIIVAGGTYMSFKDEGLV